MLTPSLVGKVGVGSTVRGVPEGSTGRLWIKHNSTSDASRQAGSRSLNDARCWVLPRVAHTKPSIKQCFGLVPWPASLGSLIESSFAQWLDENAPDTTRSLRSAAKLEIGAANSITSRCLV